MIYHLIRKCHLLHLTIFFWGFVVAVIDHHVCVHVRLLNVDFYILGSSLILTGMCLVLSASVFVFLALALECFSFISVCCKCYSMY